MSHDVKIAHWFARLYVTWCQDSTLVCKIVYCAHSCGHWGSYSIADCNNWFMGVALSGCGTWWEWLLMVRLLVGVALSGCGSWWEWLLVGVALGGSGPWLMQITDWQQINVKPINVSCLRRGRSNGCFQPVCWPCSQASYTFRMGSGNEVPLCMITKQRWEAICWLASFPTHSSLNY